MYMVNRLVQEFPAPNVLATFFNPKWVKLDTLLKILEVKKTRFSFYRKRTQRKSKQKQSGCLPQSAFFKAI
jgi:hypothetical protein